MVDAGYVQGGSRIYSQGVAGQREKIEIIVVFKHFWGIFTVLHKRYIGDRVTESPLYHQSM